MNLSSTDDDELLRMASMYVACDDAFLFAQSPARCVMVFCGVVIVALVVACVCCGGDKGGEGNVQPSL